MRKYETTFIINPDMEDAAIQELIEKVKGIISNNEGEVLEVDNWGMKKLAYEVKKRRSGYYSCMRFNGNASTIDELQRNFRIMDNLMKYIVIRMEE